MPPKRSSSAPTSRRRSSNNNRTPAKRSRSVASRGRKLSDIAEEGVVQSIEPHIPLSDDFTFLGRTRSESKKRSFDAAQIGESGLPTPAGSRRASAKRKGSKRSRSVSPEEDGVRAGKRRKSGRKESAEEVEERVFSAEAEADVQALVEAVSDEDVVETSLLVTRTTPQTSLYSAPPSLLYWTFPLDTSPDTETVALNLVDFTLAPGTWNPALSGVVQPAACFLMASLLTRRQNLVEDVVVALYESEVGFEEVVRGYGVLRDLFVEKIVEDGVLGGYGEGLGSLPDVEMLMGEEGVDEEYA